MNPGLEDSVRLRTAVLVTVMAAATSVVRVGATTPYLTVACLVGIPAAYVYSYRTRHRDDLGLKIAVAIGLLLAFAHFLASVAGLGTEGLGSVQVPLAELFLWVQILHSLHLPLRRDLMFSIASSVALIAIAGVLSTSLDLAPHVAVWVVAFVTSLVLAHRRELDELPALAAPVGDGRVVVRPVAGVLAALVVIATGVFLVVPGASANRRLGFPARLPGAVPVPGGGGSLSNPSLGAGDPGRPGQESTARGRQARSSYGYFGFSDHLDLGVRGRPDRTVVMKVRASRPDFWRGQTFDVWDGRQWTLSDDEPQPIRGGRPLSIPNTGAVFDNSDELLQTFYLKRPGPNLIFGAYQPSDLWFPDNTVFLLSDGTLRSAVQLGPGAVYTVVSRRTPVTADRLRLSDGFPIEQSVADSRAFLARYTQSPGVSDRVRRLARTITAGAPTTFDKVRAIETWLGANTRYTLAVPPLPPGADAVDQFLFVDRVGFCEQIGTSLVVMLRSLGIPARMATGYAAGERNPFTGLFEVRADDAHAWAEVWFPGVGWQGFDPTAHVPLAGEAGTSAAGAQLFSYLRRHLPHPPLVPTTAAAVVAVGGLVLVETTRRRRAERRLSWARRYLTQLESEGARRGRARQPSETGAAYVAALAATVLPDARLAAVAPVLESEAYSPDPPSDDDRRRAELVLAEAAAHWPA